MALQSLILVTFSFCFIESIYCPYEEYISLCVVDFVYNFTILCWIWLSNGIIEMGASIKQTSVVQNGSLKVLLEGIISRVKIVINQLYNPQQPLPSIKVIG